MKTKLFYSFLTICLALSAIGLTSCSKDNDEKEAHIYTYGFSKNGFVSGDEQFYADDVELVYQAVYKEFKEDLIELHGDADKCDKEAIARFNNACDRVKLRGGWTGTFTYSLYKTVDDDSDSKSVSKIIESRVFESKE